MAPILAFVPGLATGLLVGVCATAVALDACRARLPNWLTLGALLVALGLRAPGGWETVGLGMVSAALALAFGLPFYLLGGLGGLAPGRRPEVARLGIRSIVAGSLATFMTACMAGILL